MRIVITVAPAARADMDAVAGRLAAAGVTVDQILSTTGIITGSVDDQAVGTLGGLTGVAAVEPDADFQIPPDGPQ
jgi:hypothetical protein